MKHGVRIWEKKLNRTASHRNSLKANMLAQLLKHEQIETTMAKAQFIKHEMEHVINLAKKGTKQDIVLIKKRLNLTIMSYLVSV
jgi:large subunit ribosomal protein L17